MSEQVANDREFRKAQTRARIRDIAQHLFAERGFAEVTVAEVAADAEVSVQTVFNHFSSKEELFFSERAPWVDGPAEAVRSREPHVLPLTALRRYLVDLVRGYVRAAASDEHQHLVAVLEASAALCVYERELHNEAVTKLAGALAEAARSGESGEFKRDQPGGATLAASLTAAVWLAAVRSILLQHRSAPPTVGDAAAEAAVEMTERVLQQLETAVTATSDVFDLAAEGAGTGHREAPTHQNVRSRRLAS